MKEERIIFPENVEVGNFYDVPHVWMDRGMEYTGPKKGMFIPINTHLHDDKKVLKFKWKHWHIDWRFVSEVFWKLKIAHETDFDGKKSSKGKLEVANIVILREDDPEKWHTNGISDPTIYYRRVKCKRQYFANTFYERDIHLHTKYKHNNWLIELPKLFCNSKLKQVGSALICPHKGAHIDKNCKDTDGNYVCPAHLLRFDPVTLKCISNIIHEKKEVL